MLVEEADLIGARERAWRKAMNDIRLHARQRGDEPKVVRHRVAVGQSLEASYAPLEERTEIGQPDERGPCDVTDIDGIDDRSRNRHLLPLAASSRSHLRWNLQAQPLVTVPRVMARTVPFTQIAA
jgi:hypothetical protein